MNGATTDPCVNTIRLPSSSMATMIGRSQNFFRSRMNAQSSRANSPMIISSSSELSQHVTGGAGGPHHAVGIDVEREAPSHGVAAPQTHHQRERGDQSIEQDPEDDSRVDPAQGGAQCHPSLEDQTQS